MRRSLLFLALGIILGFLILEYIVEDEERRLKRRERQGASEGSPTMKDDLTLINGIGPSFEKALNALGIYTFARLAEQDADDLARRMTTRVTAERIRRDRWLEQARELARGG